PRIADVRATANGDAQHRRRAPARQSRSCSHVQPPQPAQAYRARTRPAGMLIGPLGRPAMRHAIASLLFLIASLIASPAGAQPAQPDTKPDPRLDWWRQARFGMF